MILTDERSGPCAAALVVARKEIAVEKRKRLAVGIRHFEHARVALINRNVLALLERDAIKLVRGEEDAVAQNAIELEVRSHLRLVEVIVGFANLFGVVLPVPRLQFEWDSRGRLSSSIDQLLHLRGLA